MTTINPEADAYVQEASPDVNDNGVELRHDNTPVIRSFVRFNLATAPDTGLPITFRILPITSNTTGFDLHQVADDTWGESTITHNNAPAVGSLIASSGAVTAGTWVEIEVGSYVNAAGQFSFEIHSSSGTNTRYHSRTGTSSPELVYTDSGGGGGPTPSAVWIQ